MAKAMPFQNKSIADFFSSLFIRWVIEIFTSCTIVFHRPLTFPSPCPPWGMNCPALRTLASLLYRYRSALGPMNFHHD
jgi:hypothetical protein